MLNLDFSTTALLIIDMQNDFLDSEGYFGATQKWPVESFKDVTQTIVRLKKTIDRTSIKSIYTATGYSPDGSDAYTARHSLLPRMFIESDGKPRKHGAVAIRDTWGSEIIESLKPNSSDYLVRKRRFNAFYQTELEHVLRCWNIKTLLVTGVITEVCVESTVREAFIRDFDVIIVSDGVGSWDQSRHEASLNNMSFAYSIVRKADEIIASLGGEKK